MIGFLIARIDEDEAVAAWFRNDLGVSKRWRCDEIGGVIRTVGPTEFGLPDVIAEAVSHLDAEHMARYDPARVLADCASKRQVVEACRVDHEDSLTSGDDGITLATEVLCLLALPYSDHPDYDRAWAL